MPKVSIISGIYNCSSTLSQAVKSIQDQTFCDWEWIMCDDGSTDDTLQIAKKFAQENDCIMEDIYKERVDKFFKYNDKNNSKRVYDWIKEN